VVKHETNSNYTHFKSFVLLASVLLVEVLHFVRGLMEGSSPVDHMKLKKQSFELLITPRLTNLDLSIGQLKDVPYIINLASLRCTVRDFRNFTFHNFQTLLIF
jgi:hypothetical protein